MESGEARRIRSAEVVLPCADLANTLAFFTTRLAFRIESIHPADDPAVAVIAAHGLRIRLQRGGNGSPGVLRLACHDPGAFGEGAAELIAPNGTRIELAAAAPSLVVPPVQPSFVVSRMGGDAPWRAGRAGMLYRDLIPGRQGGRFIASHIAIPGGGWVDDYVHFHRVRFQMIYCYKGWVSVVYEDQGAPFTLRAGDCVLQPPEIRHRVLESSPGLEVIELSCPAEHETVADPDLPLPTSKYQPDRDFAGQRFVRHHAASAHWVPWRLAGFAARDLELGAASGGMGNACVVRPSGSVARAQDGVHELEFMLLVVLNGAVTLQTGRLGAQRLEAGDACAVPPGLLYSLADGSGDLQFLEVVSPAAAEVQRPRAG